MRFKSSLASSLVLYQTEELSNEMKPFQDLTDLNNAVNGSKDMSDLHNVVIHN